LPSSPDENESIASSKLTLITAIVVMAFINYKSNYVKEIFATRIPETTNYKEILFQLGCFLAFVLLLPFLTFICLLFAGHRKIVERKLKVEMKSLFRIFKIEKIFFRKNTEPTSKDYLMVKMWSGHWRPTHH
jgi:hypothetical protein